ncbi:hypothetical protein HDE_07530 [Halotydeus destructor]|nr:hypothetical protein HDE_07530 [Halotydeus destructor]
MSLSALMLPGNGNRRRRFKHTAFDESSEWKQSLLDTSFSSEADVTDSQEVDTNEADLSHVSNMSSLSSSPEPPVEQTFEEVKEKSMKRLQDIIERNKNLPPHLRSSYVVEGLPGLGEEAKIIDNSRR